MRKADHGTDQDAGSLEQLDSALDRVGLDADRGDVVLGCELAAFLKVLVCHRGMQQRVVDHLGQFFVRVLHGQGSFPVTANSGRLKFNESFASTPPATAPRIPANTHPSRACPDLLACASTVSLAEAGA